MKLLTLLTMSALTVAFSAETIKFDLVKDFGTKNYSTVEGDALTVKGPQFLQFKKMKFDPAAKYTMSLDVKAAGKVAPQICLIGFFCYDKNGRQIWHHNVQSVGGSATVLAADAKVGDTTLTVKNAVRWNVSQYAVFHAKADYSDLPNFELARIKAKAKKGNVWLVTLTAPLTKAYAAGTAMRAHSPGGYVYLNTRIKGAADWKTYTGSAKGFNPAVNAGRPEKFWPGTVSIAPIMLINWNWSVRDSAVQLRNFTLTVEK